MHVQTGWFSWFWGKSPITEFCSIQLLLCHLNLHQKRQSTTYSGFRIYNSSTDRWNFDRKHCILGFLWSQGGEIWRGQDKFRTPMMSNGHTMSKANKPQNTLFSSHRYVLPQVQHVKQWPSWQTRTAEHQVCEKAFDKINCVHESF